MRVKRLALIILFIVAASGLGYSQIIETYPLAQPTLAEDCDDIKATCSAGPGTPMQTAEIERIKAQLRQSMRASATVSGIEISTKTPSEIKTATGAAAAEISSGTAVQTEATVSGRSKNKKKLSDLNPNKYMGQLVKAGIGIIFLLAFLAAVNAWYKNLK